MDATTHTEEAPPIYIPWFGARKMARELAADLQETRGRLERLVEEVKVLKAEREITLKHFKELEALPLLERQLRLVKLKQQIDQEMSALENQKSQAIDELETARSELKRVRQGIVETDDIELLQEVGVYHYRHPLTDVVAYEKALGELEDQIKVTTKRDGGAVLAATEWTVNGSAREGRAMMRDYSKLMLRAFNAEADNLVRGLKPYKLNGALDRLKKVADVIERLGKTMQIRISPYYHKLRAHELELTADFLQKEAEQKEAERLERERLREERKIQQELQREHDRLEKERQHYANALSALTAKGDEAGIERMREQLAEIDKAIEDVDYRVANIRAGYVYVISNIGSFGERMIKVGMTRRLDPMDRIRELSDASVPFNFDIHALFFSKDAVGIEAEMHSRLATTRVNTVNQRREFFRVTAGEAKAMLSELAGELLHFEEVPEAIEYRQCVNDQLKVHARVAA